LQIHREDSNSTAKSNASPTHRPDRSHTSANKAPVGRI
jgi:hypothetical protein